MSPEPKPAKPTPAAAPPPKPGVAAQAQAKPAPPAAKPTPAASPPKPAKPPAAAEPKTEPTPAPPADASPSDDERSLAMVAHLSGVLTWFVGPLLFWLLKKDAPAYAREQVREALNFQLSLLIGDIVGIMLLPLSCIGLVIIVPLQVLRLILGILATVACNSGKPYRYPLRLELIK